MKNHLHLEKISRNELQDTTNNDAEDLCPSSSSKVQPGEQLRGLSRMYPCFEFSNGSRISRVR